jgi:hypothetical protein
MYIHVNRSRNYTLVLTIFVASLLACKKEKEAEKINFPVTFYAEKAEVVSDTKVYIKGGHLNDPQKTTELMWIYSRYFSQEKTLENAGQQYLTFLSKDSVTLFNSHSPYLVERSGNMMMMTSTIQRISPRPVLQNQLYDQVAKYQNIKYEGDIQISKDLRPAYGTGYTELKIPMFAYVTSTWINGPVSGLNRRGGLVANEFNEDVISRIGDRDTIIVKRYMLTLKAR